MKISKRLLLLCLILATLLSGVSLLRVSAQDDSMTDQQIERIRSNCVTAKNTLNQLHASDALLRVNMGQVYESMSTKLMSGFNGRVSSNHFNNSSLVSATNSYNDMLDTFRSDYKTYEEQLSQALNINCLNQPVSFYDSVMSARSVRYRVHQDIVKLNQYIDQYRSVVSQFKKDYSAAADGISL
jgi:flagellar biosynthesis chaperone FliJ